MFSPLSVRLSGKSEFDRDLHELICRYGLRDGKSGFSKAMAGTRVNTCVITLHPENREAFARLHDAGEDERSGVQNEWRSVPVGIWDKVNSQRVGLNRVTGVCWKPSRWLA